MTPQDMQDLLVDIWMQYRLRTSDGRYVAGGISVLRDVREALLHWGMIDEDGRVRR